VQNDHGATHRRSALGRRQRLSRGVCSQMRNGGVMRMFNCIAVVLTVSACSTAPHKPALFTGTWVGIEAESIMLPGQHVPADMLVTFRDDGESIEQTQTFTSNAGQKVRYFWKGICDGKPRPVEGGPPSINLTLSCTRTAVGALIQTLTDNAGYSHVETCTMSANGQKHSCKGTATLPNGAKQDFVYVFNRG
jgi:hypothetical protein